MNKKLCLLAFMIISLFAIMTFATAETLTLSQTSGNSGSQAAKAGVKIQIASNATSGETIGIVTFQSGSQCTQAYLTQSDASTVIKQVAAGATADFGKTNNLIAGGIYYILCDAGGGQFQYQRNLTPAFPYIGNDLNVTTSYVGGADNSGIEAQVYQIETSRVSFTTTSVNLISPANQSTILTSGANFTANYTISSSQSLTFGNATYKIYYFNGTLFNSTLVQLSGNNTNSSLFVGNFPIGNFNWTINASYGNLTFTNTTSIGNFTFNTANIIETNQSFNPSALSGSTQPFIINLSLNPTFQISTATLHYNSVVSQIGGISNNGNSFTASTNVIVPFVSVPTNETFYWDILLNDGSHFISNSFNQTLLPFTIDNCSSNTQVLYNFSMVDEESLLQMAGTINSLVQVYDLTGRTIIATYNNTYSYTPGSSPEVCISNMTGNPSPTYKVNYIISYMGNSSYFQKYKTQQLGSLTNTTLYNNLTLYDLISADGNIFQVNIVGDLQANQAGVLVDVQKLYIPTNQFISVESATTDQSGIMIAHLIPNNAIYNFVISQNGTVLGTITNQKAYCANPSAGCSVYLNVQQLIQTLSNLQTYGNLSGGYSFNSLTNTTTFTFFTLDKLPHNIAMNLYLDNGYSNVSICTSSLFSTSGSLSCNVNSTYSGVSFYSEITSDGSVISQFEQFYNLNSTPNYYGVDLWIALLLFSCIVLMMLSHPIMIVIGAILGLVFSALLIFGMGGTFLNLALGIGFFIGAGIIIIVRISKRRDV